MIDLNIVNFFTIGLIAILFWALFKFGTKMAGLDFSWL